METKDTIKSLSDKRLSDTFFGLIVQHSPSFTFGLSKSPNSSTNRDWLKSGDIFLVGNFYVFLVNHGILHGGIDLGMAQKSLHLFNGHALVNGSRSQGPPEFMGMYLGNAQFPAQMTEADFYTADLEPPEGFLESHEKGGILIGSGIQVIFQMNLRAGIEIDRPLLMALTENHAFPVLKINILPVQVHQLPYPHAGGRQQVDDGQVP